jgi:hypothetical protein
MPTAPEAVVQAPIAAPLNGSLLQTFAPTQEPDDRWEAGVRWLPEPSGTINVWDPCDSGTNEALTSDAQINARDQQSLLYVAHDKASTWAFDEVDVAGRAQRSSGYGLSRAVERELWTGAAATAEGFTNNLFLMGGSPNWATDTAVAHASRRYGYETGLARLQATNARLGNGQGVIHASPHLVSLWSKSGFVTQEGTRLRDVFGNVVVAGGGYGYDKAPSGDVGSTHEYEWAVVTGPLSVHVSPQLLLGEGPAETVDRRTNTVEQYVGHVVNVIFDYTVHYGLRIDLDVSTQVPATFG